jgi:hypothetical protein
MRRSFVQIVGMPWRGTEGIVNLTGRGMLVVSVARQLGSGNSLARLLCRPAQAERGRKKRSGSAKLTMPVRLFAKAVAM